MNFANDTKVDPDGKLIGDPTETALVQFGLDHNFDVRDVLKSEPRVAELPFDSDRKLMSTIHKEADGTYFVAVKGAPDLQQKQSLSVLVSSIQMIRKIMSLLALSLMSFLMKNSKKSSNSTLSMRVYLLNTRFVSLRLGKMMARLLP